MKVNMNLVDSGTIVQELAPFEGKRVSVTWSTVPDKRAGFHTQVSVTGDLEKHSDKEEYRVLVDDGTYAYFVPERVSHLVFKKGHVIGNGALASIFLL